MPPLLALHGLSLIYVIQAPACRASRDSLAVCFALTGLGWWTQLSVASEVLLPNVSSSPHDWVHLGQLQHLEEQVPHP